MKKQKICSFHISDFHLLTVILPYINEKIKEEKEIITISQKDLTGEVKKYLKSVKSFECEKEKIINLDWRKSPDIISDYDFCNKIVIVIGNKDFIDFLNIQIDEKENISEIVNCYNINSGVEINEIIAEYSTILNTEGKIEFNLKNSQNAQKRKTIKSQ